MKRSIRFTMVATLFLLPFLEVSLAQAGTLNRLSAQFRRFDGHEDTSNVTPISGTPTTVWTKTVTVPVASTLYTRIYATGDSHNGTATLLKCTVDGFNCVSGTGFSAEFPGWVNVQRHGSTEDFHDNSITYGWCTPVGAGSHTVKIQLASLIAGDQVFLEQENLTIDAESNVRCLTASP